MVASSQRNAKMIKELMANKSRGASARRNLVWQNNHYGSILGII